MMADGSSHFLQENIDLAGVFNDVEPLYDAHIDKLQPLMNVNKAIGESGVPDEIRFVVPNRDLTNDVDATDLSFSLVRYARIDAMPDELRTVVRAYLKMCLDGASRSSDVGFFKRAVRELAKKTEETLVDPDVM